MSNLNTTSQITQVTDADGHLLKESDAVRSARNGGTIYGILRIKSNGRLVLWAHGYPRIRNAIPGKWRYVPALVEVRCG